MKLVDLPLYEAVTEKDWKEFEKKLASHDWYYQFSDDSRVYNKGKEQADELRYLMNDLIKIDPDRVKKLWNKYAITLEKINKTINDRKEKTMRKNDRDFQEAVKLLKELSKRYHKYKFDPSLKDIFEKARKLIVSIQIGYRTEMFKKSVQDLVDKLFPKLDTSHFHHGYKFEPQLISNAWKRVNEDKDIVSDFDGDTGNLFEYMSDSDPKLQKHLQSEFEREIKKRGFIIARSKAASTKYAIVNDKKSPTKMLTWVQEKPRGNLNKLSSWGHFEEKEIK